MIDDLLNKLETERARIAALEAEHKRWQTDPLPEYLSIDIGADHYFVCEPKYAISIIDMLLESCRRNTTVTKRDLKEALRKILKELETQ